MPYKDDDRVLIHISVPVDVRDTLNTLKKGDGKFTREYVFMHGYLPVMGLTDEDPEKIKRDIEQIKIDKDVLEEKERQLKDKLLKINENSIKDRIEVSELEARTEKKVFEIMRLSSEIINFKNSQMLKYIKGILNEKENSDIDKFFDRKDIPTEDEIRAFLD